jgi:hypothetical protein
MHSVIGAVVFAAFVVGCLLGASGKREYQKEKTDYGNSKKDGSIKKQYITHWRQYIHSYLTHYKRNRSETRHHRNPNIVWSRRTFWVVFFYTAVTFALLVVNWQIAGTAKDTEERQLRAYVFPGSVQIHDADEDITKTSELAPSLQVEIKNTGITPAYNVISLIGGALLDFPSHLDPRDIAIAPGLAENASVYFLPNGGTSIAFTNVAGATLPLTVEQKRLLFYGKTAIYLFGYIWYYDAFGIVRCTRYKYYAGGDAGFKGAAMKNASEGQDADKDCRRPTEETKPLLILPEVPHYQF